MYKPQWRRVRCNSRFVSWWKRYLHSLDPYWKDRVFPTPGPRDSLRDPGGWKADYIPTFKMNLAIRAVQLAPLSHPSCFGRFWIGTWPPSIFWLEIWFSRRSCGSVFEKLLQMIFLYNIWSNYSDLTRPHPKWFSNGNPLSGKSRLVKYYNLPDNIDVL